jgi:protoporphyrinogen oxidase
MKNVAIVGGGVAGLTLAYRLLKANHKVTIYERNKDVGGQLHALPIEGENTEIYYHHTFISDTNFIALCRELDIEDKLQWFESTMAYYAGGKQYPFGTPFDLLKFSPLKFIDKIKFVISVLRLQRMKDINVVNKYSAQEWFQKNGYSNVWKVIWEPLFKLKFADTSGEISLVWLWDKLIKRGKSRTKSTDTEKLCYMEGSFCNLAIALKQKIIALNGDIRVNTGVSKIEKNEGEFTITLLDDCVEQHDLVVSTLSTKHHQHICNFKTSNLLDDYKYQAAICVLLVLDKPFSEYYWTNIGDYSIPFGGIIEHTNFVGKDKYNGKSLVYLSRYLSSESDFYKKTNDEILSEFCNGLRKVDNRFSDDSIVKSYVFKQEDAQPIVLKGYVPPKVKSDVEGLYWISTHHVYPHDRGIEYGIEEANKLAEFIL